jgi:hypothetical protein
MTTNLTIEQKVKIFDKLILAFENHDLELRMYVDSYDTPYHKIRVVNVEDVEELVELLEEYTGE